MKIGCMNSKCSIIKSCYSIICKLAFAASLILTVTALQIDSDFESPEDNNLNKDTLTQNSIQNSLLQRRFS